MHLLVKRERGSFAICRAMPRAKVPVIAKLFMIVCHRLLTVSVDTVHSETSFYSQVLKQNPGYSPDCAIVNVSAAIPTLTELKFPFNCPPNLSWG